MTKYKVVYGVLVRGNDKLFPLTFIRSCSNLMNTVALSFLGYLLSEKYPFG